MKNDPTLYEPKCMFCGLGVSGSLLLAAGIGAAGSIIGGMSAADAAESGADAQVRSAEIAADVQREGLTFSKETFDIGRADLAPWRSTGTAALQASNNLFIPGGHAVTQLHGQLNDLRARKAVLARTGAQPTNAVAEPGAGGATGGGVNLTDAEAISRALILLNQSNPNASQFVQIGRRNASSESDGGGAGGGGGPGGGAGGGGQGR